MKKRTTSLLFSLLIAGVANAQNGRENIDKLCGCFSVNFQYAETFSPKADYKYHEREDMNAIELVLPIEKSNDKYVMQHLLVINDTMVIKHWREEWAYQSPVLYEFKGNKQWQKKTLDASDVAGTWTQTVWEVNDEPRYQGVSRWINNDGKTYWENTADAPLPRREYSVRNDYNILRRHNRIAITKDGYQHEQDNDKIIRQDDGKDELLAQEKGYNTYYKIDDKECTAAREYWKKNEAFWSVIRHNWDEYIAKTPNVSVKEKVDDKILGDHFTALWKEWNSKKVKTSELDARVKEVLAKFL